MLKNERQRVLSVYWFAVVIHTLRNGRKLTIQTVAK